jgi:hypothetical protein
MSYEIRTRPNLLVLRFSGVVESEDLQRSIDEIEEIEATWEKTPDRITDISMVDTEGWSLDIVEELAERRRHASLKNSVRSAIYAPTDVQFGFSRIFQILNDNPNIEVAVFRELAAAAIWVERHGAVQARKRVAETGFSDNSVDPKRAHEG